MVREYIKSGKNILQFVLTKKNNQFEQCVIEHSSEPPLRDVSV